MPNLTLRSSAIETVLQHAPLIIAIMAIFAFMVGFTQLYITYTELKKKNKNSRLDFYNAQLEKYYLTIHTILVDIRLLLIEHDYNIDAPTSEILRKFNENLQRTVYQYGYFNTESDNRVMEKKTPVNAFSLWILGELEKNPDIEEVLLKGLTKAELRRPIHIDLQNRLATVKLTDYEKIYENLDPDVKEEKISDLNEFLRVLPDQYDLLLTLNEVFEDTEEWKKIKERIFSNFSFVVFSLLTYELKSVMTHISDKIENDLKAVSA